MEFRIGLNVGDVMVKDGDIFGDGVNIAARLEALAEPGGICVSGVVRDQVRDKLDFGFEDLGEQQGKNIARPIRVSALRPEAVAGLPASSVRIATLRHGRTAAAAMAAVAGAAIVIAGAAWGGWPALGSSPMPTVVAATTTTSIAQPLVAPRLSIVALPFANSATIRSSNIWPTALP